MQTIESWLAPGALVSLDLLEFAVGDWSQWKLEPQLHVRHPDDPPQAALERLVTGEKFAAGRGLSMTLISSGGQRFNLGLHSDRHGRLDAVLLPGSLDAAGLDRLASLTYCMSSIPDGHHSANRDRVHYAPYQRFALPGVAPLTWFGEPVVSWFGGDAVFDALPDGWAERTEFGQWRVVGLDPVENPEGFVSESWSVREAAVIEALGREFFFDPVSGWIPEQDPPVLAVAPYPVYRWIDGGLVIQEPDGSTRPAALDGSRARVEEPAQVAGPALLAQRAALFEEEFRDMGFGEHLDDSPLSWVEEWSKDQTYFEHRTGVELIGSFFGEKIVGAIAGVSWVETDGGWRLAAGGSMFDPFELAEGLMSRRPGMSIGLFMAAIRAASLPNSTA